MESTNQTAAEVQNMTFTVDGKEFSLAQLMEMRAQADAAAKVLKKAEKEGFIEKAKKAPKEKEEDSPAVIALKDALQVVLDAHKDTIEGLFKATIDEGKPLGNIGVNLNMGKDHKFHVQLLNEETRKAKTPKKEKKAKTEEAATPATEAPAEA